MVSFSAIVFCLASFCNSHLRCPRCVAVLAHQHVFSKQIKRCDQKIINKKIVLFFIINHVLKHVIWLRYNKIIEKTNQYCIFWYEIQLIQSLIIKRNNAHILKFCNNFCLTIAHNFPSPDSFIVFHHYIFIRTKQKSYYHQPIFNEKFEKVCWENKSRQYILN